MVECAAIPGWGGPGLFSAFLRPHQRPWSPVIAIRDIEQAGSNATITIGRSTVVTPAARDRARELSVTIVVVEDAAEAIEWSGVQSNDLIEALVEFSCLYPASAVPPEALEAAQNILLDSLSVAYAGSAIPAIISMIPVLRRMTGSGKNRIIGQGPRLPAAEAAMLNATLIHAQEYEAVDPVSGVECVATTIATAMAAAEEAGGVTGRGFLATIAIALEVAVRLGRITTSQVVLPNAAGSMIGGLTAAIRLYRLEPAVARNAITLALAYGTVPGAVNGDLIGPGVLARNIITNIKLAAAGIDAGPTQAEGAARLLGVDAAGKRSLVDGLGQRWAVTELAIRRFPAPLVTHAAIEAIQTLEKKHKLRPDRIDRIDIEISGDTAKYLGDVTPESGPAEQRHSLHYLASLAIHGDITCESFAAGPDPDILAWTERVSVRVRPENGSDDRSTTVRIRTTGRRTHTLRVDAPLWIQTPPSRDDRIAKLRSCWETAGLKTWTRPNRIASAVDTLIDSPSPSIVWTVIAAE
jgi:2-methylcitrate dehydratase PrpD